MTRFRLLGALLLCIPLAGYWLPGSNSLAQNKEPEKKAEAKKDGKKATAKKADDKKAKPIEKKDATPVETLNTLPGFQIELVHTADPATEGSFINLAKGGKNRLLIGGQRNQPITRAHIGADGKISRMEKLDLPISEAMGILIAFDALYVNGFGPQGFGIYRCVEDGDTGKFKEVQFIHPNEGSGEHGPHAMVAGPDNKLWFINGNMTKLPKEIAKTSPHRGYQEDHLLPRQWDGNGHAAGILAPGGHILRIDPMGKGPAELVLAGFRNAYDFAFNGDGELFTYDSDMEWDWGMPWYRPTRVNHCVSGGEFGWRSGTGKWPEYYIDSLPATLNIGLGSPTGVTNGIGAKFPAKYQKAVYVLDWTYGRLIAVHMKPEGSSYSATWENLVAPKSITDPSAPKKPLNLTDAVVNDDGHMYFTTGGRNTQSGLYRVKYVGTESTAPAELKNTEGQAERALRHDLEKLHGKPDAASLEKIWAALGHKDRFIRSAARVALEFLPLDSWKAKAYAETNPVAALTALTAVVHLGTSKDQNDVFTALGKFSTAQLPVELQLDKLRVIQLACTRLGKPNAEWTRRAIEKLNPMFPNADERVNRELAQVLIYFNAPGIAQKCLDKMAAAKTQEEMIYYMFHLRTLPIGSWTMDQRKTYISYWTKSRAEYVRPKEMEKYFAEAGRPYSDGNSFSNFYKNFLREAVSNMSDAERKAVAEEVKKFDAASLVSYEVAPRPVVKAWSEGDIYPLLDQPLKGRNYDKGREAYFASQCIKCHRFGAEGGAIGPELTAISSRFSRKDVIDSILYPSKVISDQYQNETFLTTTGRKVTGRIVDEDANRFVVQPDSLSPEKIEILKKDVELREPSKLSPMPEHLIDVLTKEDILDLLAYLESAGNKRHPVFQK